MISTWQRLVLVMIVLLGCSLTARWATAQALTGAARIKVDVPADARVIINDYRTRSTGRSRAYISRGLLVGHDYPYHVRVVGQHQGRPWSREETITLRAGETKRLVFSYSDPGRQRSFRVPLPDSQPAEPRTHMVARSGGERPSLPVEPATSVNPPARGPITIPLPPAGVARDGDKSHLDKRPTGHAWFLHQVRSAEGQLPPDDQSKPATASAARAVSEPFLTKWYSYLTGGRAMEENLALAPQQASVADNPNTVPVDSIRGVNVRAFDWGQLTPREQPALDALAAHLPADQHAIFFPSAQQAQELAERATRGETVFLRLADPRTTHWRIRERYEQQFGMPLDEVVALLGSDLAGSVALTGSDPFVAMGTDVAIVIESPQPAALAARLVERTAVGVSRSGEVENQVWTSHVLAARGVRSADRRVCSYVAALPEAVVLTNSVYQLQKLSDVQTGTQPSLASLPEFAFFRERYRLGDTNETALVVISDATIRRWGSPRWRIGQARRRTAAAALAQWQADWLGTGGMFSTTACPVDPALPEELKISDRGVYSRTYGSLEFMTPISEFPLSLVTVAEKTAYETWRDAYERRWVRFDPIAMRLGLHEHQLDVDLTVMPLTLRTEYASFRSLTQGAKLRDDAGDPHDSCAELAVAFNTDSQFFRMIQFVASAQFSSGEQADGFDPLAWFDGTVTVYVDEDPTWEALARKWLRKDAPPTLNDAERTILAQVPVGIQVEVTSGLELTKFLVALRAAVEGSAPGMLKWELCEYRDAPYAKVSVGEMAKDRRQARSPSWGQLIESASIYYAAFGDALIISPNEKVLRHALDRRLASRSDAGPPKPPAPRRWLGDNVSLRVDAKLLQLLAELVGENRYQRFMQTRSWNNLPILNEWKRLYPDEDPVVVHERLWNVRPVCAGGGHYVWNEAWQTMESTVYGHPAAPKPGPALPKALQRLRGASAGLTFEANGLRARFSLQQRASEGGSEKSE